MTKAPEFVMPKAELMEDYEPTTQLGRKAEDNPFTATVAQLETTYSEELKRSKSGIRLAFPLLERTRVVAKFSRAAKAAGYSPRFDDKANEGGNAVIVAYLVQKITRTSKKTTVTQVAAEPTEAEQLAALEAELLAAN